MASSDLLLAILGGPLVIAVIVLAAPKSVARLRFCEGLHLISIALTLALSLELARRVIGGADVNALGHWPSSTRSARFSSD